MNIQQTDKQQERFFEGLDAFRQAPSFLRAQKLEKLLGAIDALQRHPDGMRFLYEHLSALLEADLFAGSSWASPDRLHPSLVGGTLVAGHPTTTLEILSELRLLALAEGKGNHVAMSRMQARQFLERAIVANFELLFEEFTEPSWREVSKGEQKKIHNLFSFLLEHIPLSSLKGKIRDEVDILVAHRPVVTVKLEKMLEAIDQRLELSGSEAADRHLLGYVNGFLRPSPLARECPSAEAYRQRLENLENAELSREAGRLAKVLDHTGLVSAFHVGLLRYLAEHAPELIPRALALDDHGKVEFERHQAFVCMLVQEFIIPANRNAVYGLARVLERNLFSRPITWNALNRLLRIEIDPRVEKVLKQSNHTDFEASAQQLLLGGVLNVLGHPLGVRQGNNPTCQSARGISMWSRHAPGKLLNLLIDAASADNIAFRFGGELIESTHAGPGLARRFDYKLDPVSVVLVPHLDRIYNDMMRQAALKYPGKDPHVVVNPAFYGQWIQTGFISVYNPLTAAIDDYAHFVRVFYASFHPEYNGGHHLAYPVPLGIFITDAEANMLGYHAVSLLRIARSDKGEWRAYFFNPNSEGLQDWGQGIRPGVGGNGEKPGESSLPVHEFVSRVYAYHYNAIQLGDRPEKLPKAIVETVTRMSRESWGRKYLWTSN